MKSGEPEMQPSQDEEAGVSTPTAAPPAPHETTPRRALLVLGMHRSGTSAATRVASLLGGDVPKGLMAANDRNPLGHWESAPLVNAHDALLHDIGSNWHDWSAFDRSFWTTLKGKERKAELRQLLHSEFGDSRFLVLKDPRICRFADAWLEILAEAGYRAYVLLPLRNPLEIAASLHERDGLSISYGLLLWLRHALDAEFFTRQQARSFLRYEDLLEDWTGSVRRVADQLGMEWPVSFESAKGDIEQFLTESLRHHHTSLSELLGHDEVSTWVKDTYQALLALSENPRDAETERTLDEVRRNLTAAEEAFGRGACPEQDPIVAYRVARKEVSVLARWLQDSQSVSAQRHDVILRLQQHLSERETISAQRHEAIQHLQQRLAEQDSTLAKKSAELVRLGHDLEELRTQSTSESARRIALETEYHEGTAKLRSEVVTLRGRDEELRRRGQEAELRCAALHQEIEHHRRDLDALAKHNARLESTRRQHSGKLAKVAAAARKAAYEHTETLRQVRDQLEASYQWSASVQRWADFRNLPRQTFFSRLCLALFVRSGFGYSTSLAGEGTLVWHWGKARAIRRAIAAELKRALFLSGHFDARWYTLMNASESPVKPGGALDHFVALGLPPSCSPNGIFNVEEYQRCNPDVPRSAAAAFAHYLLFAIREKRRVHALFDREFYLRQYPDVGNADIDPLAHFISYGWRERRDPHPCFSVSWYLEAYPDVADAGINPLAHYLNFGAAEKRDPHPSFSTQRYLEANPSVNAVGINPLLHFVAHGEKAGFKPEPSTLRSSPAPLTIVRGGPKAAPPPGNPDAPLAVCVSAEGNFFMREIAEHIVQCLEEDGRRGRVVTDREAMHETLGKVLVVAPHEFFVLGSGPLLHQEARFRHAAMLNTEQAGTSWFSTSCAFLEQASEVYELSEANALILQESGVDARVLGLPFLANSRCFEGSGRLDKKGLLESLPERILCNCPDLSAPLSERPLDVLFVGQSTEWRQQRMLRMLPGLVKRRCFLHIPESLGPLTNGGPASLSSQQVAGLSRRSKVLLNLHRSEDPYFEWHRVALQGFLQKTLVLSEPLPDDCGFTPGEHYLSLDSLDPAGQLSYLLETSEGLAEAERVRYAAYLHYAREFPATRCRMLLESEEQFA